MHTRLQTSVFPLKRGSFAYAGTAVARSVIKARVAKPAAVPVTTDSEAILVIRLVTTKKYKSIVLIMAAGTKTKTVIGIWRTKSHFPDSL